MIKSCFLALISLPLPAPQSHLRVAPTPRQNAPVQQLTPAHPASSTHRTVVKKIRFHDSQDDLEFPLIIMEDTAVARKINARLQHEILQQPTPKAEKRIFDKIRWKPGGAGLDELGFTVLVNSDKLLALEFDEEWMAAYPSSDRDYFQFDVHTGAPIRLDDIVTAFGRKQLEKDLRKKRQILIDRHLEELKKNPDAQEDLDEIRESLLSANELADPENFSIRSAGLLFHKGNSLPHVIQALDADLDIKYSFHQISPWLTDFGKRLLLNP
jgi:hypothetical protein